MTELSDSKLVRTLKSVCNDTAQDAAALILRQAKELKILRDERTQAKKWVFQKHHGKGSASTLRLVIKYQYERIEKLQKRLLDAGL